MKLLCLGCLHGKIPRKLIDRLKKEEFDYVLCLGDLAKGNQTRKLMFRYWNFLTSIYDLEIIIGKNKLDKIIESEIKSMIPSVKFLKKLNKKVFSVYGNNDYLRENIKLKKLKSLEDIMKKSNIKLIKPGMDGNFFHSSL